MSLRNVLPKEAIDATHYIQQFVRHIRRGKTEVTFSWLKLEKGIWYLFETDNDNEYPSWILADKKQVKKSNIQILEKI